MTDQALTPTPLPQGLMTRKPLADIIAEGEGIDLAELAVKAELSAASAGYCLEAFRVVVQALREAKLLPARQAPEKAPAAPEARVQAEQAA